MLRIRRLQRLKRLKFASPIQVFVGPPFRTPLLLPQGMGALVKMLFLRTLPMFVGPLVGATLLLPKKIGAIPNNMVQILLRLGQDGSIISKRLQRAASAHVHPGTQAMKLAIRHQFLVGCCLQCFIFILSI